MTSKGQLHSGVVKTTRSGGGKVALEGDWQGEDHGPTKYALKFLDNFQSCLAGTCHPFLSPLSSPIDNVLEGSCTSPITLIINFDLLFGSSFPYFSLLMMILN
jgi:hypothetical protein